LPLLALFSVLGVAALTALGVWQLERRVWKLELIARITRHVHAEPIAAPGPSQWPQLDASGHSGGFAYLRVHAAGQYLNDRETLVQAVTRLGGGFWVLTPLRTVDGFTILVNRGFVPADRRDPATRAAGQLSGRTLVSGLLRATEPGGAFLHTNDPAADRWYSRDVAAIASARALSTVAPYFIDADATPVPGGLPVGGLTQTELPNHHLLYALTWFALALLLGGAAIGAGREQWRIRNAEAGSRA
jgi:surfeit locus 1 family protein